MLIEITYADGGRRFVRVSPTQNFGVYCHTRNAALSPDGVGEAEVVCSIETDGSMDGNILPGGKATFDVMIDAISIWHEIQKKGTDKRTVRVIVTPDGAVSSVGFFKLTPEQED